MPSPAPPDTPAHLAGRTGHAADGLGHGARHVAWRSTTRPPVVARRMANLVAEAEGRGGHAVIMAPAARLASVRELLPDRGTAAELIDVDTRAGNPALIVDLWCDVLRRDHDHPVVGVCESIHASRSARHLAQAHRADALLNRALPRDAPLILLCLLDATMLDEATVTSSARVHQAVVEDPDLEVIAGLEGLRAPSGLDDVSLAPAPATAHLVRYEDSDELQPLRAQVERFARTAGLADAQVADAALVVDELAANSLQHGGGAGELRMWQDGGGVVCEVIDGGHILDPLAGLLRPDPRAAGGRGLWVVHQLADLVEQRTDELGTVTRVHFEV